ncbi:hypothetical protein QTO34_005471, partial [Cnephaeus nilssonii]
MEPGNQAATFYNCPFPSHSDRDVGEDTMFSCCLPVSPGRGLKRGSDESIFRRARRWIRSQPRRRLWPFARWDLERSTKIKMEQQLVEEDSFPLSRSEGPVSHTTEGQGRPEVRVVTWAAGEPGPGSPGLHKPPTSKPLSPYRQMPIFYDDLKRYAPVNITILEDLEPNEAEPNAPAQEAEEAPPDAELEAPPPPELSPPPAASPAAAVEPGRPQRKLRPQHRWMENPPWSPCWLLPQRRSCLWRAQLKGSLLNVLTLLVSEANQDTTATLAEDLPPQLQTLGPWDLHFQ